MSASLVGSEMCIRDRYWAFGVTAVQDWGGRVKEGGRRAGGGRGLGGPVSYTHLTLPTICSV
eukprot:13762230-Alexandrium_andersonii.AAC.1